MSARPIRFRAWDNDEERMFVPTSLSMGEVTEPIVWEDADALTSPRFGKHGSAVVLMQYTGLSDAVGTEIYEHDVVEHRNFLGELVGTYTVQWGQFGFTLYDPKHPAVMSHYVSPNQLTVVGNTHENKEFTT